MFRNGQKGRRCLRYFRREFSVDVYRRSYLQFPPTVRRKTKNWANKSPFIIQNQLPYVGLSWRALTHRFFCRIIRSYNVFAQVNDWCNQWESLQLCFVALYCVDLCVQNNGAFQSRNVRVKNEKVESSYIHHVVTMWKQKSSRNNQSILWNVA